MGKELSAQGARFIRNAEGLRLRVYLCAAGKPTIGYGHVLRAGDPKTITRQQAEAFFAKDVAWAVDELNKTPGSADLEQHQFDALVSFIFNIGAGAWRGSTARRDLIEGKIDRIPGELMRWIHDDQGNVIPGLKLRRAREVKLWESGVY
jgi:lysozyme